MTTADLSPSQRAELDRTFAAFTRKYGGTSHEADFALCSHFRCNRVALDRMQLADLIAAPVLNGYLERWACRMIATR